MKRFPNKLCAYSFQILFFITILFNPLNLIYAQENVSKSNKPQSELQKSKQEIEARNWFIRADSLTTKLRDDLFPLSDAQKALTLIQIARLWWTEDNAAARNTLRKSISLVSLMNSDSESVRSEKLAAARLMIATAALFDKQSTDQLIEQVENAEKEQLSKNNPELNAQAILSSALTVVASDPPRAFQLGSMSLRYGIFQQTITLAAQLSLRDGNLASRFAIQTANTAVQRSEHKWINALSSLIFIGLKGQNFSDEAKKTILDHVFNETFNQQAAPGFCNSVLRELSLISFYEKYSVEKTNFIRQKAVLCRQGAGELASSTIDEKLGEAVPKTVDELISAARGSKVPAEKAEYFMRAIKMLDQSKDYLKILTLLDDMNEEERKVLGDFGEILLWERLRWDYAYKAGSVLLKEGDLNALRDVVDKTPGSLRPMLQNDLATDLIKAKDNSYAFELLQAARKNISKVTNKNLAAETYLKIFRTYTSLQPLEAPTVFSELVKVINEGDAYASENKRPGFGFYEPIVSLPAEILELDEIGTYNSLTLLTSPESKTKLRLGLIAASLKKYKEKSEALKKNKPLALNL